MQKFKSWLLAIKSILLYDYVSFFFRFVEFVNELEVKENIDHLESINRLGQMHTKMQIKIQDKGPTKCKLIMSHGEVLSYSFTPHSDCTRDFPLFLISYIQ